MLARVRSRSVCIVVVAVVGAQVFGGAAQARARHRSPPSITFQWVGDIALSAQRGLPAGGIKRALAPVRALLRSGDVTLGNLEGTLSVGGISKCSRLPAGECFAFQAPPSTAGQLRGLGFDLVNQANNHALDYGLPGRQQTIAALDRAGLANTGFPGEITVLRVAGMRVAFLGFAPYPSAANLLDIPAAQALVRKARRRADLVVVAIHAGAEGAGETHTPYGPQYYLGEDRGDVRAFTHAVVDAGASIVLGSGPHVIRGIERYRGHLIAYSLGDFVGYHTLASGGVSSLSAILRVTLDDHGRVLDGDWIPLRLVGGLPRPDPTGASARLVGALSRADFPADHFQIKATGLFR
jgi:hypothetical protein